MSLACCDLLQKLLTPEPEQRITLSRIMRHPWFVRDAPPGLLALNSRLLRQDRCRQVEYSASVIAVEVSLSSSSFNQVDPAEANQRLLHVNDLP